MVDVVPGMNNLTLTFDDSADVAALERNLKLAWASGETRNTTGKLVEIPVRYGGEYGPDIADVAAHTGLTPQEVVRRHAAGEYVVYFLGFQPGFAYMGGLAPELATPRRREPSIRSIRTSVRTCRSSVPRLPPTRSRASSTSLPARR